MITLDKSITSITPDFRLGVIEGTITVNKTNTLDSIIENEESLIRDTFSLKTLLEQKNILCARNAYKAYGKDPSRYRLAVESLFRRIIKGNHIYRINDVVDIGNILSLKFACSTAVLDRDKVIGHVKIRLGINEPYIGIGRGPINISNIPVYEDEIGPFGSTTSDTLRTMITDDTKQLLFFIISFNKEDDLSQYIAESISMYESFTNFELISSYIIKNDD